MDNEPLLFQRIMDGEYFLDTEPWEGISAEAKDIVSKMMARLGLRVQHNPLALEVKS